MAGHRIYSGPSAKLESYNHLRQTCARGGPMPLSNPSSTANRSRFPDTIPPTIAISAADGNSVVLKLDEHAYALYAPHAAGQHQSPQGRAGKSADRWIGLVGNTGNLRRAASALSCDGWAFVDGIKRIAVRDRQLYRHGRSLPAQRPFDEAEGKGVPARNHRVLQSGSGQRQSAARSTDHLIPVSLAIAIQQEGSSSTTTLAFARCVSLQCAGGTPSQPRKCAI